MTQGLPAVGEWEGGWSRLVSGRCDFLLTSLSSAHFLPPHSQPPFQDLLLGKLLLSRSGSCSEESSCFLGEHCVLTLAERAPQTVGEEPSKPMTCSPAISTCFWFCVVIQMWENNRLNKVNRFSYSRISEHEDDYESYKPPRWRYCINMWLFSGCVWPWITSCQLPK